MILFIVFHSVGCYYLVKKIFPKEGRAQRPKNTIINLTYRVEEIKMGGDEKIVWRFRRKKLQRTFFVYRIVFPFRIGSMRCLMPLRTLADISLMQSLCGSPRNKLGMQDDVFYRQEFGGFNILNKDLGCFSA